MDSKKIARFLFVQCCVTFIDVSTKPLSAGEGQKNVDPLRSRMAKSTDHSQAQISMRKVLETWLSHPDYQDERAVNPVSNSLTPPRQSREEVFLSRQIVPTSYKPWSWFSSSGGYETEEEKSFISQVTSVLQDDSAKRLLKDLVIMFMGPSRRSGQINKPKDIFVLNEDMTTTLKPTIMTTANEEVSTISPKIVVEDLTVSTGFSTISKGSLKHGVPQTSTEFPKSDKEVATEAANEVSISVASASTSEAPLTVADTSGKFRKTVPETSREFRTTVTEHTTGFRTIDPEAPNTFGETSSESRAAGSTGSTESPTILPLASTESQATDSETRTYSADASAKTHTTASETPTFYIDAFTENQTITPGTSTDAEASDPGVSTDTEINTLEVSTDTEINALGTATESSTTAIESSTATPAADSGSTEMSKSKSGVSTEVQKSNSSITATSTGLYKVTKDAVSTDAEVVTSTYSSITPAKVSTADGVRPVIIRPIGSGWVDWLWGRSFNS